MRMGLAGKPDCQFFAAAYLIGNLILLGVKKSKKSSSVKPLIPHFQGAKPLFSALTTNQ